MTRDQIVDEMINYLDAHPELKTEIDFLFSYSDPFMDYSKGRHTGQSPEAFYGTLQKAITSYLVARKIDSLYIYDEIEMQCDYFYWRLLVNALVAIFIQKKQSKVYTNPQHTKSFSLDAAGMKYCYAYSSFDQISFVLWARDKSYEHIKLILKFGRTEYNYSIYKDELVNKNVLSITGKYNGRQVTKQGTLSEITRTGGFIEDIVNELTNSL